MDQNSPYEVVGNRLAIRPEFLASHREHLKSLTDAVKSMQSCYADFDEIEDRMILDEAEMLFGMDEE